jgi:hypothetical protein
MSSLGKNKSLNIPAKIAAEIQFISNRCCCICQKQGDHIHHLNDKYDHTFPNLALLCFDHHHEASVTGGLKRKLSKEEIIRFRDHHYKVIENRRKKQLGNLNHKVKSLTEETLLSASINALIIVEIAKIKSEYFDADFSDRQNILRKLNQFNSHLNPRIAFDLFEFFTRISNQTRNRMSYELAFTFHIIVIESLPSLYNKELRKESTVIAQNCIQIGKNVAYDAFIHLRNLAVAMCGLTILKHIYICAKENRMESLKKEVLQNYEDLGATLSRPERDDLENAKRLTKIFKDDLDQWGLNIPPLPTDLIKLIDEQKS